MMTPEGIVKKEVKKLLDKYKPELYYYMPVPTGFGRAAVDFLGCLRGQFFAIETKAPGGKPTPRQDAVLIDIRYAGGAAFVIAGDEGMEDLERWLEETEGSQSTAR